MTAQTSSARMVARQVSKVLGREVSDKRVRAWVRDNVPAFDDDGYTTHAYDARTVAAIVKGMTTSGKAPRAESASNGRKGKASAPKPRKATVAPATDESAS